MTVPWLASSGLVEQTGPCCGSFFDLGASKAIFPLDKGETLRFEWGSFCASPFHGTLANDGLVPFLRLRFHLPA